jgi:cell division protein FtsI/penicillin-binding protein 2
MNVRSYVSVIVASFALWLAAPLFAGAASRVTPAAPAVPPPLAKAAEKAPVKAKKKTTRRRYYTSEPTFADSTAGDYTEGEDPAVRQAAIRALGKYNGSVVVVDTSDGRVLTMVNQKLALSNGYVPCSTIKLVAGLAALKEGLVEPETKVWFSGKWSMTLTEGLAISNNVYFAHVGQKLGFERVRQYAHMFGFGEKAGWEIPGEQLGEFSEAEHKLGVGRMTSFGDGVSATPLQLAAFVSALANGGTLYYLQLPRTDAELRNFTPRVKRQLPVADLIPGIESGMLEAVKRGTGKNARVPGQMVWGKTGTCSQWEQRKRTRLGWFASYNQIAGRKLAVVVLLRGGPMVFGPRAAEVAGNVYRDLSEQHYFSSTAASNQGVSLGLENCCSSQ